ncbi:MAG: OsmC family protein [Gaiellaceae bacterium]
MDNERIFFPVRVDWLGAKRVSAFVAGKQPIDVATPPPFDGGIEGVWSPEDFFVGAAASCFAVTLAGIAAKSRVPLHALAVDGLGVVGKRDDGRTTFLEVELNVSVETDDDHVAAAEKAISRVERHCLVALALGIPVRVSATVHAVAPAA